MTYPITDKFKQGVFTKPTHKQGEFFVGGSLAMQKRLRKSLAPFPGAYDEFLSRSENLPSYDVIALVWDYIHLV